MSLSIVIIHAAPQPKYLDVLKRTIQSIRTQRYAGEVEVIVADDGSCWSQSLLAEEEDMRVFDGVAVRATTLLTGLSVDAYVLARTSDKYLKAQLWNQAVAVARHDKLIFLDDDHPFASIKALSRYSGFLDRYEFVFGRVRNPDGTYRRFGDTSVQGTNFAMHRDLLTRIGGFGEKSSDWGCGEDSDLFWKVYTTLNPGLDPTKRAFFAANIVTSDLCTGRWVGCQGGVEKFISGFQVMHSVHPHSNPARTKKTWVERPVSDYWFDFLCRVNNFFVNCLKKK